MKVEQHCVLSLKQSLEVDNMAFHCHYKTSQSKVKVGFSTIVQTELMITSGNQNPITRCLQDLSSVYCTISNNNMFFIKTCYVSYFPTYLCCTLANLKHCVYNALTIFP